MPGRVHKSAIAVLLAVLCPIAFSQGRKGGAGAGPGARRPAAARPMPPAFERLSKMSPEQRQRVLEKLPPERKKQVEQRLEQYNKLSPEERERLREQYDVFRSLPPERQDAARRAFHRFNNLPDDRRPVVRQEFQKLRALPDDERRARMNSDEFRNKYSRNEQQLLADMTELLPPR